MTKDERDLLCTMADLAVILAEGQNMNFYTKEIRRLVDKVASLPDGEETQAKPNYRSAVVWKWGEYE